MAKKNEDRCPHCGFLFADGFVVPHAEYCGRMDESLRGAQRCFNVAADRVRTMLVDIEPVVRENICNELDNATEDVEEGITLLWKHMDDCHGPQKPATSDQKPGTLDVEQVRILRTKLLDGLRDHQDPDGAPTDEGEVYGEIFECLCVLLGEGTSTCGDCRWFKESPAPAGARCRTQTVGQDAKACAAFKR